MIVLKNLNVPGHGPDGVDIPYFEISGDRPGPRLTVIAGVHGGEYASMAAVRQFVREIDPATVTGTIVAVPVINILAFWARSAFVVPADDKNLNRTFPGDAGGTFTEVLAHKVYTELILGSDFLVDMHAGDIPEALESFAMYEESPVEETARTMALAYGSNHVMRQTAAVRTVAGSSAAAAADAGIPAVIVESGQNGLLDDVSVAKHLAGLRNIARTVGVLDGEPNARQEPAAKEHEGWHWMRTEKAGWWEPVVATGVPVEAGALLGTVSDVWGDVFLEVRAPEAGTMLFLTTSPAVAADGLLLGLAKD